ncbi:MAG: ATPase [bacterium]
MSSSKIEQQIDAIEDYIDNCKFQAFSKTNIIVDKDELDELLEELRNRTPEEIKSYRRIIANKENIIEDARRKADDLINDATNQSRQMVDESEIVARAENRAAEILNAAEEEAQRIMDEANAQVQSIRESANNYVDGMLGSIDEDTTAALSELTTTFGNLHSILSDYITRIRNDRRELAPQEAAEEYVEEEYAEEEPAEVEEGDFVNTDMM